LLAGCILELDGIENGVCHVILPGQTSLA
jgi:hypothetical protein